METKSLETASKDCSAHIACLLAPQYKHFSSQSLPRAHVAHATHLEIKATQGSKGEKTKKKQRVLTLQFKDPHHTEAQIQSWNT